MNRHRLYQLLRHKVPSPWVVGLDNRHASRIIIRDPRDQTESRHGRWLAQLYLAQPVPNATIWHHPQQMLDYLGGDSWMVAFDDEPERTGFKDEIDLADWLLTRLQSMAGRDTRRVAPL